MIRIPILFVLFSIDLIILHIWIDVVRFSSKTLPRRGEDRMAVHGVADCMADAKVDNICVEGPTCAIEDAIGRWMGLTVRYKVWRTSKSLNLHDHILTI